MSGKAPRGKGAGKTKASRTPPKRRRPAGDRGGGSPDAGMHVPRLHKLEESATYNERALEELTAQMLDLDGRLRRLVTRLEGLESRIIPLRDPTAHNGGAISRPSDGVDARSEEP